MTSPAPLVRPPIPGSRNNSSNSARAPRLGLSIPASPNIRPVASTGGLNPNDVSERQAPPSLTLKTPQGRTISSPAADHHKPTSRGLTPLQIGVGSSVSGSSENSEHSGSVSENVGNIPVSASSSVSAINLSTVGSSPGATGSPATSYIEKEGIGMVPEKELDQLFSKLRVENPNLDAEDLDDTGWKSAAREGAIVELSRIGEGAGGSVAKCILKEGKTVFALKVITTNPDPDVKKQIVRELNFNKTCASQHICRYYGAFLDDHTGTISIAMEFCEGGSLDSVYKEVQKLGGRTGEKVLGKVADGVLNGLTYLHQNRIIHRDIKPSNILLCRDGQVKLCDFGVSGEFGTKGDANTFIGTSYYMAPERITGQSYTITSDVWSLGVTLLEVAQHRFPFPADGTEMQPRAGLIDLLTYIVRQDIPKLKDEPEKNIFWSDSMKYFIECCLEKEPTRRATPWRMLEHPWMVEIRAKRVNMEQFLRKVWDWKD